MRAYDKIPFIPEPVEFGKAFADWWLSVQPSFRASDGDFPKQVYSDAAAVGDPWTSIRKSGTNGFVSVVTMMRWWGMEALYPSNNFKKDSRDEWRYLVYDIRMCVEEMMTNVPKGKAKRKRDTANDDGKENKRYVGAIHLRLK